jgi:hypothetical protein
MGCSRCVGGWIRKGSTAETFDSVGNFDQPAFDGRVHLVRARALFPDICSVGRNGATRAATCFITHKSRARTFMLVNVAVLVLLFVPRSIVLVSVSKQPPLAHKVWSVVLQKGTWQAMNTGSEFAAARQLTFAGDRIIAIFDAGSAGYQGKEPMSKYRLLSVDPDTGEIENQTQFTGRWGAMPYIYGTHNGKVAFASSDPIRLLNRDLSETGIHADAQGNVIAISPDRTTLGLQTSPGTTFLDADTLHPIAKISESSSLGSISNGGTLFVRMSFDSTIKEEIFNLENAAGQQQALLFHGTCGFPAEFLNDERLLITGCGKICILDTHGKVVGRKQALEQALLPASRKTAAVLHSNTGMSAGIRRCCYTKASSFTIPQLRSRSRAFSSTICQSVNHGPPSRRMAVSLPWEIRTS